MNRLLYGLMALMVLACLLGSVPVGAIPGTPPGTTPPATGPASAGTTPGTTVPATSPASSPAQAYQQYLEALRNAQNLSDVMPCLTRSTRARIESQSGSNPLEGLKFLQAIYPREVRIVRETVNGDQATIFVEGMSADPFGGGALEKTYGTIDMQKEDGGWKIDRESWSNHPPAEPTPAPSCVP